MSKPLAAIALDVFCPSAYRFAPWSTALAPQPVFYEGYDHESDFVYVVLQPLLFRGRGAGADAFPVAMCANPVDWFRTTRTLTPGDLVVADADLANRLADGIEPVPVALPPGTELRLELFRAGVSVWDSSKRTIGPIGDATTATSAFSLPLDAEGRDWPAIASVNFLHPLATTFDELSSAQREEVYVWLAAAVVDLLENKNNPKGRQLTTAQNKALVVFELEDPPSTPGTMRAHLVESNRGQQMYELLLTDRESGPDTLHLTPPRFKVLDGDAFKARVRSDIAKTLPVGATHASYLHVWWQTMCAQADQVGNDPEKGAAWADPAADSELAGALGRYFGFGERLRWPVPAFDVASTANQVFMVPVPKASGNRFETNAVSLCELVFRIPVSIFGGDPDELTATLSIAGLVQDDAQLDPTRRLGTQLAQVVHEAAQWRAARLCRAMAERDTVDETGRPMADAHGFVMVQPRAARCVAVANPHAPNLFAVPAQLIDLADDSARHSLGEGEDGLVAVREPRRALFPEDCLNFEALPIATTHWRIRGDLRAAPIVAGTGQPQQPLVYEFVASRLAGAALGTSAPPEPGSEADRFKTILPSLLTGSGPYGVSLWLPDGAGVVPLSGKLVDADGPDSDLRFYILDEKPDEGIGAALGTAADGGKAIQCDLVVKIDAAHAMAAQAMAFMPFNVLEQTNTTTPWVALRHAALSRVSRSVDRWMERFHVTPAVDGGTPSPDDPIYRHLINFNKLRVFGRGETEELVPITYPDAAVPLRPSAPGGYAQSLPWENGLPSQPPYGYFVSHLYSQETSIERPALAGQEDGLQREPEAVRYARYIRAEADEAIFGYLEHQYSYRIPIVQRDLVTDARLASDVRNVAALVAHEKGGRSRASASTMSEGEKCALLEVDIADTGNAIVITGHSSYFRKAFTPEEDAEEIQKGGRTLNVDVLRALYEAVQDLLSALADGEVELHVHAFRFDNQLPSHPVQPGSQIPLPARLYRFATGKLRLRATTGAGMRLYQAFMPLAPVSFAEFSKVIANLRIGEATELFAPIHVDLDDATWTWDNEGGGAAPNLELDVNVLRAALDVHREPERVVDPSMAEGRMIPFTADDDIPGWIKAHVDEVLVNAREELRALLRRPSATDRGSSLYYRREWLRAVPPRGDVQVEVPAPQSAVVDDDLKKESREGRWRVIFGDFASSILVPPGAMRPVRRVVELFYFPVAFRPLEPHRAFGGANDTLAFTEFLLTVVGNLLDGLRPPEIIIKSSADGAADDGARAIVRLRELLAIDGGIATSLQGLAHHVHNAGDLKDDPSPLTVRAIKTWDEAQNTYRRELRRLLTQTPQVFATARAIGVVLFDRDRFAPALHSLQLWKRIVQDPTKVNPPLIDVDRFVISSLQSDTALVLDPLEAARYDAEFELPQNVYTVHGKTASASIYDKPIDIGSDVEVTVRGAASGRTGEDFLESLNHFPPADETAVTPRGVEVDAPHWNPHWSYDLVGSGGKDITRQLYLLPSRRFPATPVNVQMAAVSSDFPVNTTSISVSPDLRGSEDDVFGSALKSALKRLNGEVLTIRAESAETPKDPVMWRLAADGNPRCSADEALGWHRVDTFLEHHYFLVEGGEQGEDPFANELFEIEVQVNREGTLPAPIAPPTRGAPSTQTSPLIRAFQRWQQKSGQSPTKAPLPAPGANESLTLPELVESLGHWLSDSAADSGKVPVEERDARDQESLLRIRKDPDAGGETVRFRAQYVCAKPDDSLTVVVADDDGGTQPLSARIGSVVTVSMFETTGTHPVVRGVRGIVRVSVLADPWSRCRVRMRQIRNRRDIDGGQSDIDPVFEMPSPFSVWSAYAHPERVLVAGDSTVDVPPSERRLEVASVSLREWIKTRFATPAPDIGAIVKQRLSATVPGSGPYSGKPYWNSDEMLDPQRVISAVLRQRQPDRHIAHDGHQVSTLPHRDLSVPRHVFGNIAAGHIDDQLRSIAPSALTAGEPELEIAWLDKSNGAPICRARWPIRFTKMEH
jgi:hypothetical protein